MTQNLMPNLLHHEYQLSGNLVCVEGSHEWFTMKCLLLPSLGKKRVSFKLDPVKETLHFLVNDCQIEQLYIGSGEPKEENQADSRTVHFGLRLDPKLGTSALIMAKKSAKTWNRK